MTAYYVAFKGKDHQFYFNLLAGNHEPILRSTEGYQQKAGALNGIASVQKHCPDDSNYVQKIAKDDSPYFVLRAKNNEPIGISEMYSSKQAMLKGLDSVKRNGVTLNIRGLDEDIYGIYINDRAYGIDSKEITGSEILKVGGFTRGMFCVFLIEEGGRTEVKPNQSIKITKCRHFKVVRND